MNLRVLLTINAVATAAAGVVLFVSPNLIGGAVGIELQRSEFFVYYLLGANELGTAALAFFARGVTDTKAVRAVSLSFIVFHALSGLAGAWAWFEGLTPTVWWNVALRVVMVVLFARLGFKKPHADRHRP